MFLSRITAESLFCKIFTQNTWSTPKKRSISTTFPKAALQIGMRHVALWFVLFTQLTNQIESLFWDTQYLCVFYTQFEVVFIQRRNFLHYCVGTFLFLEIQNWCFHFSHLVITTTFSFLQGNWGTCFKTLNRSSVPKNKKKLSIKGGRQATLYKSNINEVGKMFH